MITHPRSERVKGVAALARRPARRRTGRLLVEGPQAVREAVRHAPGRIVDLYVTAVAAERYPEIVDGARQAGRHVHDVSEEVLAAMADADTPQGMLAVCDWTPASLADVLSSRPRCVVLLTHVRDPGNLGTIVRGADAAGADAVLISEASVDVTAPKVVRSSVGSLFHLPIVTGLSVAEAMDSLRAAGLLTLAADGGGSRSVDTVDLRPPHAWVMGNEAWGLAEDVRAACDDVVRVPIYGHAESLNLAMASTVCLYASARAQRPPG